MPSQEQPPRRQPRQNRLADRASLRRRSLLEGHQRAIRHLHQVSRDSPVVAAASRSQEALEGAVIMSMAVLHAASDARVDQVQIERIEAGSDSLVLHLRPGSAPTRLSAVVPWWNPGAVEVASGEPGVRHRSIQGGAGLEFYHLRAGGSVRVLNGSQPFLDDIARASLQPDVVVACAESPIAPQEINSTFARAWLLPSLLIRRFGIIRELRSDAIDTWWNTGERLSVEALGCQADDATMRRVVTALQSPEFWPRLELKRSFDPTSYHTHFSVSGTDLELDLRVQR